RAPAGTGRRPGRHQRAAGGDRPGAGGRQALLPDAAPLRPRAVDRGRVAAGRLLVSVGPLGRLVRGRFRADGLLPDRRPPALRGRLLRGPVAGLPGPSLPQRRGRRGCAWKRDRAAFSPTLAALARVAPRSWRRPGQVARTRVASQRAIAPAEEPASAAPADQALTIAAQAALPRRTLATSPGSPPTR